MPSHPQLRIVSRTPGRRRPRVPHGVPARVRRRPFVHGALFGTGLFLLGNHLHFDHFTSAMAALAGLCAWLCADEMIRYYRRVIIGQQGEESVKVALQDFAVDAMHDVYLPGRRGSVQIDHVACFPGGLVVIETKTYNGRFEMSATGPWYRLASRRRRYATANPLAQLDAAKKTLAAHLPDVRIWGMVVLAGRYTTTGGHPPNVISLRGLRDDLADRRRQGEWQISDQTTEAWQRLHALKNEHAGLAKTHVMDAKKRRGETFYDFEEIWLICLWGALAVQFGVLGVLAWYGII